MQIVAIDEVDAVLCMEGAWQKGTRPKAVELLAALRNRPVPVPVPDASLGHAQSSQLGVCTMRDVLRFVCKPVQQQRMNTVTALTVWHLGRLRILFLFSFLFNHHVYCTSTARPLTRTVPRTQHRGCWSTSCAPLSLCSRPHTSVRRTKRS